MRISVLHLLLMLSFASATIGIVHVRAVQAAEPNKNTQQPTLQDEQIAKLIENLDANEYFARQLATHKLLQIGQPAIRRLTEAVLSSSLEASYRSMALLERFLEQNKLEMNAELESAFDRIAESRLDWAASSAQRCLTKLGTYRQDTIIAKLNELGADADVYQPTGSQVKYVHLYLDADRWRGKNDELLILNRVHGIFRVTVLGDALDDSAVDTLCKIKMPIKQWDFYGTRLSDKSLDALKKAFAGGEIQQRKGALFGIKSDAMDNGRGCYITTVHPNSAAHTAGIRVGDLMTKIEDTPIRSFKEFSSYIVEKRGGDKVAVRVIRNGATVTAQAELSSWKIDHVRDLTSSSYPYGVAPKFCPGKAPATADKKDVKPTPKNLTEK